MAFAQQRTVLAVETYGWKQDMVQVGCVQSPDLMAEFHTNPGEEHLYAFDTNIAPMLFMVNDRNEVLMCPGDSVHVVLRYQDKRATMELGGTAATLAANDLRREVAQYRRALRYKSQLLACVAVDVQPAERIAGARQLQTKLGELLDKYKGKANEHLAQYVRAEQEASIGLSLMEYPAMYAEVRKKPIAEQNIGDYWTIMEGYPLRSDRAAMMCPDYASFLMRYCLYQQEKQAVQAGQSYTRPEDLEAMFAQLATFYKGVQRDCVLYHLLANFIRQGKQLERVQPLLEQYKREYEPTPLFVQILEGFLQ